LAEITTDTLRKLGMTVDAPTMNWAAVARRRVKTDPVDQGGRRIFHTSWAGLDMINPAGHIFPRGNGKSAAPGWPDSPEIEAARNQRFTAPDAALQRSLAERLQRLAFRNDAAAQTCGDHGRVGQCVDLCRTRGTHPVGWPTLLRARGLHRVDRYSIFMEKYSD